MKQGVAKVKERYNWPVTILLNSFSDKINYLLLDIKIDIYLLRDEANLCHK